MDKKNHKGAIGGLIFGIFRALSFLEPICFFITFLSFFFQVPVWCYEMGTQITKDCSIDQNRVEYYTTKMLTFEMWPAYFISWGCQTFLVLNVLAGIPFAKQRSYIVRAFVLLGLLAADVVSGAFFMLNIWKSGLNSYFKIAFIILYSQTLRKGMVKLLSSMKDSSIVLLIYLVNLLVWSGLAFVLFCGNQCSYKTIQTTKIMKPTTCTVSNRSSEQW